MSNSEKHISELFETISNSALTGDVDLKLVIAECNKLKDLASQIGETREAAKIKQLENAIEELNKTKQNLGDNTLNKHLDEAMNKFKVEIENIKKQVAAKKASVQGTASEPVVWKQQTGKKQVKEGAPLIEKGYFGLGNGIECRYYLIEDEKTAPKGFFCRRKKDNTFFIVINDQTIELPNCYFHVHGDHESDTMQYEGTKFFIEDLNDGKQDPYRYADVDHPEGNHDHVAHQVNLDGINRVVRKVKHMPVSTARAIRAGHGSLVAISLLSILNTFVQEPKPEAQKPKPTNGKK